MLSKLKNNYLHRLDVKLTTYYTLIVLLIAVALGGFFFYRLQHNLMKQVDKLLRDEAHELIQEIERKADVIRACKIYEGGTANRKFYPIYFRVINTSGNVLYVSKSALKIPFPPPKNKTKYFCTFKKSGRKYPFRLYEKKAPLNNSSNFTIQIATEAKQLEKIMENVSDNILTVTIILLLLSIGGGIMVARKPRLILRNITTVTNRITSQNLSERLPVPQAKDEVKDLILTINSMMDRLEKSFSDLKQFTADVSHELRNPLFALKGEMEVALSQKRDAQEYREEIYECLDRVNFLIKMVNDLFLISRYESKKANLELDYVDFRETVGDIVDFFLPMAQEKNLQLTIDRCDDAIVLVDKAKILQTLNNLLDNAIKFTPKNGSVSLTLVRKEGEIELRVRDSGIGIPEDKLQKIFNRFYQVDESRSGSGRGTGLGLHICKQIVEAHEGSIRAECNKDKGVTFIVTLPKV